MEYYLFNINSFTTNQYQNALCLLSSERKAYINSISNSNRKIFAVAGEWFIKTTVADYLGLNLQDIVLLRSEKGKPYIEGKNLFISLSHSGNYIALAIEKEEIGIDIEVIRPINKNIANRICTAIDKEFLSCSKDTNEQNLNLLKIWTAKEAYFKKLGTGITDFKGVSYNQLNPKHFFEKGLIITKI